MPANDVAVIDKGQEMIFNNIGKLSPNQTVKGHGWECTGLNNGGIMCQNNKGNGFSINKKGQTLFNRKK